MNGDSYGNKRLLSSFTSTLIYTFIFLLVSNLSYLFPKQRRRKFVNELDIEGRQEEAILNMISFGDVVRNVYSGAELMMINRLFIYLHLHDILKFGVCAHHSLGRKGEKR